jgi:O-succinylbenzoic acid--CoA ligase
MERAELSQALRGWRRREAGGGRREPILISEPDSYQFMAVFAEAVAGDSEVFLCDPTWGEDERAQVTALLARSPSSRLLSPASIGWLMIPTGGSGGQVKFARHDQDTIVAAVHGFTQHFGFSRVNALGVLPLHHVSGLMAWMRCALTGGEYRHRDWRGLEGGEMPRLGTEAEGWVISLVGAQLYRLLRQPAAVEWLRDFRIIFVGGGPVSMEIMDRASSLGLRLSPGYGMTETAAMVTGLRPDEFAAGARDNGSVLPHAAVTVAQDNTISVAGGSLFRGYYPHETKQDSFATGDLGRLDAVAHLTVFGRRDEIIISGGEKILPGEVEARLLMTGEFQEVVVVGLPDPHWGQIVVAAYSAATQPDLAKVRTAMAGVLAPYKQPKHFVPLGDWPANSLAKIRRLEMARRVAEQLKP